MPFISLYGTDGCGKSTLAEGIAAHPEVDQPIIIGGSTYKQWPTGDIADTVMGKYHSFDKEADTPEEKTRLYEDIAIVCYGFARNLIHDGHNVIIDSDPYLKRIIWGTLNQSDDQAVEYVSRFNERMSDFLPTDAAPHVVVGLNATERDGSDHYNNLLERITRREGNSDHDPKSITEVESLDNHVRNIWSSITKKELGKSALSAVCRERLQGTIILEYENHETTPEQLPRQIKALSQDVVAKLFRPQLTGQK